MAVVTKPADEVVEAFAATGITAAAMKVEAAAPAAAVARRRLNPAQLHALGALPARMEALGREIAPLRQALADPTLYARDRGRFERFSAALAEKQAALAAAEEEWLALEMLREEIEAAG